MDLCKIRIEPSGDCAQFARGTLLTDALAEMGVFVNTPCGGNGRCGKCRMKVDGWFSQTEDSQSRYIQDGQINACRERLEGDAVVHLDLRRSENDFSGISNRKHFSRAAVDIGTTTVKLRMSDSKSTYDYSFTNPQRRYGHDVISRIQAASDPVVASKMKSLIRGAVKNTVGEVEAISFSGNTTMLYLLLGLDTAPLGRSPFTAPLKDFHPDPVLHGEKVMILPVADAFIGADVVGGISLVSETHRGNIFFADFGTNGEMAMIGGGDRITATSCAMGPALEGMNISCGICACEGAVTHVREQCGKLVFQFEGDTPLGLTGTALIDILAILLKQGAIDHTGRINTEAALPGPASYEKEGIRLIKNITLTQRDIRNLQLAKAASLAGSRLLLDRAGLDQKAVDRVCIAGALGENLELDNIRHLDFLPDFENAEWSFLGNTSLQAAQRVLTDSGFLLYAKNIRDRIDPVNLSAIHGFQREFFKALNFSACHGEAT